MVFYFTLPNGYLVYMGKNKYENEKLIKYAWKEDLWFHVDDLSSAHVYLRLKEEFVSFDNIPLDIVEKCAQLTKENSIEGCKKSEVDIIYTPASNLKKTDEMEIGAVAYHNKKMVKILKGISKDKDVLKALEKTKVEAFPDLEAELENHEAEKRRQQKRLFEEQKKKQLELEKQKNIEIEQWEQARKEFEIHDSAPNNQNAEDDFL